MKTFGKKCKCGHFESDHANENKKFYEPNAPAMLVYGIRKAKLVRF